MSVPPSRHLRASPATTSDDSSGIDNPRCSLSRWLVGPQCARMRVCGCSTESSTEPRGSFSPRAPAAASAASTARRVFAIAGAAFASSAAPGRSVVGRPSLAKTHWRHRGRLVGRQHPPQELGAASARRPCRRHQMQAATRRPPRNRPRRLHRGRSKQCAQLLLHPCRMRLERLRHLLHNTPSRLDRLSSAANRRRRPRRTRRDGPPHVTRPL